jgi:hypothetical protein
MKAFYRLGMFPRLPKEDMTWSGGCIGVWSVIITHVYSTEARIESGQGALKI